jgi:hypothetical protein
MVDPATCKLDELYDVHYRPGGRSTAGSADGPPMGARFRLSVSFSTAATAMSCAKASGRERGCTLSTLRSARAFILGERCSDV